ncbi:gephyrin-like molybdotransferase receptor GlpR [Streptomyces sparsogenes]|uniref:divisome protein SepX/GlpR n=1 Tax=Streptomyces sparsogenes TaxID=67365 RepID=UPI0033DD5B04
MSSSGLIYAVIVGAWAAYLVPMWLRRQDELNEARPTERFSTAIRLLSGRAGMERRYAKERADLEALRGPEGPDGRAPDADRPEAGGDPAEPDRRGTDQDRRAVDQDRRAVDQDRRGTDPDRRVVDPDAVTDAVDVRAFADPVTMRAPVPPHAAAPTDGLAAPPSGSSAEPSPAAQPPTAAARSRRAKVLARRRRTTIILFLAFTLGAVVAAVGGLAFLWAPGMPAVLLSAYIAYLRSQERRRFTFTMDQRRAELAAQRLRERRPHPHPHPRPPADGPADAERPAEPPARLDADRAAPTPSPHTAGRRALVEQTDHAEWVDQQRERERGPSTGESWEPVPVPLPTYVTAPVAPRATGSVDLGAPDAWSSARSSTVEPTQAPDPAPHHPPAPRTPRERGRTPLFDQYADDDRPRAANE